MNIKNTYGFIIIDKYGIYRNKPPSNRWLLLCSYEMQKRVFHKDYLPEPTLFKAKQSTSAASGLVPRVQQKRKF